MENAYTRAWHIVNIQKIWDNVMILNVIRVTIFAPFVSHFSLSLEPPDGHIGVPMTG